MNQTTFAIVLGCAVVVLGCLWGVASASLGRRTRNWLYYVETVGAALVVAGIVGQRFYPSDDAVRRIGADAAGHARPGVWEAGILVPALGVYMTPVTVLGFVTLAAGVALLLFFESADRSGPAAVGGLAPLDRDDAC